MPEAIPLLGSIADYFHRSTVEKCLVTYADFARSRRWELKHKLELYNYAKLAFASTASEAVRREAFQRIYHALPKYWQVFRGCRQHWSADQIFDALSAIMRPWSRQTDGGSFLMSSGYADLREALRKMRSLKATRFYPGMAVSKFLHFFNPCLFPIYDTAVMENYVLRRFRRDYYGTFLISSGLTTSADKDVYLLRYTAWAHCLIQVAGADVMTTFADWFKRELDGADDPHGVREEVHHYFATAFEFIAIGAAHS